MLITNSSEDLRGGIALLEKYEKPKITVFGSARTERDDPRYHQTARLGAELAAAGFMVITGGGPGMMEAAASGAGEENSIAFGIDLPMEQGFNPVVDGSERAYMCKYFFTRKVLFLRNTAGVVLTAGGLGTMDEAFETLTLIQTGCTPSIPVVLLDCKDAPFWLPFLHLLESMVAAGTIEAADKAMFHHSYDVSEAVRYIQAAKDADREKPTIFNWNASDVRAIYESGAILKSTEPPAGLFTLCGVHVRRSDFSLDTIQYAIFDLYLGQHGRDWMRASSMAKYLNENKFYVE